MLLVFQIAVLFASIISYYNKLFACEGHLWYTDVFLYFTLLFHDEGQEIKSEVQLY